MPQHATCSHHVACCGAFLSQSATDIVIHPPLGLACHTHKATVILARRAASVILVTGEGTYEIFQR